MDKLVFAVNQPNREELKNIIESEVSDKNSGIYEKFQEEIFHWLGEAEGTCITKENFKDYKIVAGEFNKKYEKSPWIRSMVPGVMHRLELLMFYVHRAFIMHEYGDFSIQVGDRRDSESNYILFCYEGKSTCMSTEYKNMKENSKFDFEAFLQGRQEKELSLNERFKFFLTLSEVEHFVIYVEELGFTEERAKQLGLNAIDIQKKEHKILKDCVCTNDKRPNFYKLPQETRKRFLNLFDIAASEERKNVFLDKLYQFPLHVKQIDNNRRKAIMK